MNLTPEEKFNQTIWWVLKEIKKEGLATRKDHYICFEFQSSQGSNSNSVPSKEDQKRAIRLLESKGIIKIKKNKYASPFTIDIIAQIDNIKPIGYLLEILQPKFDEVYKKFRKLTEKYQPQYSQPKELFTNEVIPDRTAEIQRQMNETIRRETERLEREKLHREQLKQDRILRTPIDKYTHALDLIIERAEYAEDGNNFSIEFYDFNFEKMIGSEMLEKFLTKMQKDGCFKEYTRTNYAGGTRFGFIKPSIKKIKAFKEKRKKQKTKTNIPNKQALGIEQLLGKLERDIKEKSKTKNINKIDYQISFDEDKSVLYICDKNIKIRKFSNQYYILKIVFKNNEAKNKDWQLSEIAELIDSKKLFEWKLLYNTVNEIKKKIAIETQIKDFFITTTQSIKINEKYLKKS